MREGGREKSSSDCEVQQQRKRLCMVYITGGGDRQRVREAAKERQTSEMRLKEFKENWQDCGSISRWQ